MTRRMEKVADLLQSEIADLLRREVQHSALSEALLSITHVEVAPDLSNARVHFSVLPRAEVEDEERHVLEALEHVEPFLHRELVKRLHMRRIPRLRFFPDHSMAEADRLTSLMREVAHNEGREL